MNNNDLNQMSGLSDALKIGSQILERREIWDDLWKRWQKARVAALKKMVDNFSEYSELNFSGEDDELETYYITQISQLQVEQQDEVLKTIFGYCFTLGRSFSRYTQLVLEIADLKQNLIMAPISCFHQANLISHPFAFSIKRNACESFKKINIGALYCDYWREAIDGLVSGLSEDERMVRHFSAGHGDDYCLDVVYSDSEKKMNSEVGSQFLQYADLPFVLKGLLEKLRIELSNQHAVLKVKGVREKVLFYEIETDNPLCGKNGLFLHRFLEREVKNIFPDYSLKDSGPLAVMGIEQQ